MSSPSDQLYRKNHWNYFIFTKFALSIILDQRVYVAYMMNNRNDSFSLIND